ncbi:MAG: hypothetical protein M3N95_00420 [Actinomycetota bacterium]|nr:hypothetical protein [Actinomycetota bacterium]
MSSVRVLDWVGVVVVAGCAALAGLLELFLVPLYTGSTLVPIAVLLSLASNTYLPRLSGAIVPSIAAAALPFVAWLVVIVGIGLTTRPEGDVVLPGGGGVQWVGYGVLLGGALAATVTLVLSAPAPRRPRGATPPGRAQAAIDPR